MGGWLILNGKTLIDRFFLLNPSNEMKVKESRRLAVAFIRGIRRSRDKMIKT